MSFDTIIDEQSDLQLGAFKSYCIWIILFIALFFRVFNVWNSSLWTDEIATYWVATAPTLSACIERAIDTQGMSPFYFILERFMLSFLPHCELTMRLLSLISSMISVYLVYYLGKMIFPDDFKALLASLIFSIHEIPVYYAQEARPYALGIMFVLISQIFFLKMLKINSITHTIIYITSSVIAIYCHYVFIAILIVQGLFFLFIFYLKENSNQPKLGKWIFSESVIIVFTLLMLRHFFGMFSSRYGWNWLKMLSPFEAAALFIRMFDLKVLLLLAICFIIFLTFQPNEKNNFKDFLKKRKCLYFLFAAWLLVPFLFICLISYTTGMRLFDPRYMVLSMIPFFYIIADGLCVFKSYVLRIALPGAYFLIYFGFVSIPNCIYNGNFSKRIPHDWRNALAYVNSNYRPNDVILLRAGFEKENWIPMTDNPIVKDYGKSPFKTFYWKGKKNIPIYNLTYTWDETFYPYYDFVFERATRYSRVWIIGVETPNTNYPLSNISRLLTKEFSMRELYRMNFSGVYVALLSSD